jgi:PAS domain S-box-containing protein
VFRTGEAQEGIRERGRPGAPAEAWRVRAVPVFDAGGALTWVAESFVRLTTLAPDLAGRAPAPEAGGAALIVLDREERIVSWSPVAATIFGHTLEEALGRRIDLIVPEDRLEEERALAVRVAEEGKSPRFETVRRARDGRRVPVALAAVALRDEAGALIAHRPNLLRRGPLGAAAAPRQGAGPGAAPRQLRHAPRRLPGSDPGRDLLRRRRRRPRGYRRATPTRSRGAHRPQLGTQLRSLPTLAHARRRSSSTSA